MIIRITNTDDFQIIFEVVDSLSLKNAIQTAWQKITILRPQHFVHSKEIQVQTMLDPHGQETDHADAQIERKRLIAQAIECRQIMPGSLAIHLFNQHAYGVSYEAAVDMQDARPGRPPEAWITAGGYPVAGDALKPDPDAELTVTRNSNNLGTILERLHLADKHAELLVTINRLRKSALKNET